MSDEPLWAFVNGGEVTNVIVCDPDVMVQLQADPEATGWPTDQVEVNITDYDSDHMPGIGWTYDGNFFTPPYVPPAPDPDPTPDPPDDSLR